MFASDVSQYLQSNLIGKDIEIKTTSSLNNPLPNSLLFLINSDENKIDMLNNLDFDLLVICDKHCNISLKKPRIIVDNPKYSYVETIKKFWMNKEKSHIDKNTSISKTAIIGKEPLIKRNVVIEENVLIGNNCIIEENVIIRKNTIIGNDCVIRSNTVIGGEGFGFVKNQQVPYRIPHLGKVVISDNCEIGENSIVNRGTIDDTKIGENVKISTLVKIAHNVDIKNNVMIATGVQVSGSVCIAEGVWIGTNSTILNKVSIGEKAIIGVGSVVVNNVQDNSTVKGNPAK